MTQEAIEYLTRLIKMDPSKFYEIVSDENRGLTSVILNMDRLTFHERVEIRYHIENGSPAIVMERRNPGGAPNFEKGGVETSKNELYIHIVNSEDIDKAYGEEHKKFVEMLNDSPVYILSRDGKPYELKSSFACLSEKRLRQRLQEELEKENYEVCAQIRDHAKKRGINL